MFVLREKCFLNACEENGIGFEEKVSASEENGLGSTEKVDSSEGNYF